jgi:hypothetical protein
MGQGSPHDGNEGEDILEDMYARASESLAKQMAAVSVVDQTSEIPIGFVRSHMLLSQCAMGMVNQQNFSLVRSSWASSVNFLCFRQDFYHNTISWLKSFMSPSPAAETKLNMLRSYCSDTAIKTSSASSNAGVVDLQRIPRALSISAIQDATVKFLAPAEPSPNDRRS